MNIRIKRWNIIKDEFELTSSKCEFTKLLELESYMPINRIISVEEISPILYKFVDSRSNEEFIISSDIIEYDLGKLDSVTISSKLLKQVKATQIYCVPTGNNITRGSVLLDQIKCFDIEKFSKTIIYVKQLKRKVYINGADTGLNSGWLSFLTEQDALNHINSKKIINKIKDHSVLSRLSYYELKEIENIIDKSEGK